MRLGSKLPKVCASERALFEDHVSVTHGLLFDFRPKRVKVRTGAKQMLGVASDYSSLREQLEKACTNVK